MANEKALPARLKPPLNPLGPDSESTIMFHARTRMVTLVAVLLTAFSLSAAEEGLIDSPMYRLPPVPGPKLVVEYGDAKELWLKALSRPEAEMKCQAAETIASAHEKGIKGLEIAIDPLVQSFVQKDAHPAVRLAIARTLIRLDAKSAAEQLFAVAKTSDVELREIIEPALARWDYRPARSFWLERLSDPKASIRERQLAMRSLAVVKEKEAITALTTYLPTTNPSLLLRLDAAGALGSLQAEGLEERAKSLLANNSRGGMIDRIVALKLLQSHRSQAAVSLLQASLRDEEPGLSLLAAETLLANDAKTLVGSLDWLLSHRDPGVRRVGVEVIRRLPEPERLDSLVERLGDDHVDVRTDARKGLVELAKVEKFRERILQGAMKTLASNDWKALEQAAILVTDLDHKPAAQPLLEVLKNPRPETFVAAAWGLRKLDVPETLPGALRYVAGRFAIHRNAEGYRPFEVWYDHQLSQLMQFLGQRRYAPAEGVMRQFAGLGVGLVNETRCASVWGLGMIHEGKPVRDLGRQFEGMIRAARAPVPGENIIVARMAVVSLGRMKAKDHLAVLREYYDGKPTRDPFNNSCGWAIEQITGEKVPDPGIERIVRYDWFLIPVVE